MFSSTSRETLAGLASDCPPRTAVNAFIDHSRQVATAYLLSRSRRGQLHFAQFDLPPEDLALDCLADLFRRDDDGRLIRVQGYLKSVAWESLDDAGLEIALRRLIFSAVNEGLFRRYRENDPTVGRLIRTLKQHAADSDRIDLRRARSTRLLELCGATAAQLQRPTMPPEVLEAHLHQIIGARPQLRKVVDALADLLEAHPNYAPSVSLPDLALGIRNVLARRAATHGEALADTNGVDEQDLRRLVQAHIEKVTSRVQQDMKSLYIGRRGLPPFLYQAYILAVRDILRAQFSESGTPDLSFREVLNSHVRAVSSREYRKTHQAVLEYLVTLCRARLLRRMAPIL